MPDRHDRYVFRGPSHDLPARSVLPQHDRRDAAGVAAAQTTTAWTRTLRTRASMGDEEVGRTASSIPAELATSRRQPT